ncbi:MAG TPA: MarC family protein [Spirochaetota bacterium]|nr:MarC family protein [Spirochaetota bacterium]HOM38404.1 MarC family protein [Spirochaetota bacterium]HPQ48378.1 MarC family protein [Spirochaetota bacterium]
MLEKFLLCFIPLFVAVDAIGILPIFLSFAENLEKKVIKNIIFKAVITASIIATLFLFAGSYLLYFLGITIGDFMIAGGTILFIIAVNDITSFEKKLRKINSSEFGIVPVATPLIVGPGVLTTILLLTNNYGYIITSIATLINIIIAGLIFLLSDPIYKILKKSGVKAISKIASLLLASIGIMMIRKGIMSFVK